MTNKDWARECLNEFLTLERDTTQERIKRNRQKMLLRASDTFEKSAASDKVSELIYEYQHYFDTGFRSKYNIETLPTLIESALIDMASKG